MKARDMLQLIQYVVAANHYAQEGDTIRRMAMDQLIDTLIQEEEANEDQ